MKRTDDRGTTLPTPRRRRALAGGLLLGLALAAGSCTFLVDTDPKQCRTSDDCAAFGEFNICTDGYCRAVSTPPGCVRGQATTNEQLLNACTTSDYFTFDNCARLGLCSGAALPALIPPGT